MSANIVIDMEGFNKTINCLKKQGGVITDKVIKKAMREGPKVFIAAAKANARKHKNKKRKEGKHLYQSIGMRLRVFSKNDFIFVAAGGLYQQGGYHAHLLELGHRIVRGGTLERSTKIDKSSYLRQLKQRVFTRAGWLLGADERTQLPGITAAGKRWLNKLGLKNVGRRGVNLWQHEITGKRFKVGERFAGERVRGGGKLTGQMVPGYPFMKPAWEATKHRVLSAIKEEIKMNLVDQAVALALAEGAVK